MPDDELLEESWRFEVVGMDKKETKASRTYIVKLKEPASGAALTLPFKSEDEMKKAFGGKYPRFGQVCGVSLAIMQTSIEDFEEDE